MSKIDDLIKELCPNGVTFKSIDSVADLYYGKGNNIPKDGGEYPVYGCYGIVSSTSTFNNEDTPIVGHIGSAGKVSWGAGKHYVTYNGTICNPKDKKELNSRYLYHVLLNVHLENYVKGSQPFLSSSDFGPIKIAIPPLEVQNEIVRILDKFGELEAELEAELEERKNQYEFWCGKIISESNGKYGKLIELLSGPVTDGPHTTPKLVDEGIPFISATAVHEGKIHLEDAQGFITKEFDEECSKKYKPKKWDVYMVKSGSTTGKVAIVDIDADFNIWSPLAAMRTGNEITSKFLYHLLQTKEVQEQVQNRKSHGSQPNLSMRVLEQFDVKIPTLEEQERIVSVLDKFDALVNDITIGLPAEIELRRKQYEYYRNKLLSFEEDINE